MAGIHECVEKLNYIFSCKELLFHCNKIQNKLYLRPKNTTRNKYQIVIFERNYNEFEPHSRIKINLDTIFNRKLIFRVSRIIIADMKKEASVLKICYEGLMFH